MLNTKLNLYNAEWLDVVFDDRNKAYGAYDLRKHYAGNMVKAILIMIAFIVAGWMIMKFTAHTIPADPVDHTTVVELPKLVQPPVENKKPDAPKPEPVKPQPTQAVTRFVTPVVTDKPERPEEPAKIDELEGPVGPKTTEGVKTAANVEPVDPPAAGGGGNAPSNTEIYPNGGVEVSPEPFGGMGAFSKFLSKNLRYPAMASDAGVAGRVIVSFVIERDGSLSNIAVERGAGYGMDQEAVRVLKLAKAWKPGMQNGQPVRVRYMIPINFQLPE